MALAGAARSPEAILFECSAQQIGINLCQSLLGSAACSSAAACSSIAHARRFASASAVRTGGQTPCMLSTAPLRMGPINQACAADCCCSSVACECPVQQPMFQGRPLPSSVKIVEVGPRDGLQNEKGVISTEVKVGAMARCGLPHPLYSSGLHACAWLHACTWLRVGQHLGCNSLVCRLLPFSIYFTCTT